MTTNRGSGAPPGEKRQRDQREAANAATTLVPGNLVDVLGRYSRLARLTLQLRSLLKLLKTEADRAASSSPPRVHKLDQRIDCELTARIAAEYEVGTSSPELARQYGLGKGSVLKLLHEADVRLRLPRMSEVELQEARRLYEGGLSLVEVGKRLDRDHSTIYKALKRRGVRMRDNHGRT